MIFYCYDCYIWITKRFSLKQNSAYHQFNTIFLSKLLCSLFWLSNCIVIYFIFLFTVTYFLPEVGCEINKSRRTEGVCNQAKAIPPHPTLKLLYNDAVIDACLHVTKGFHWLIFNLHFLPSTPSFIFTLLRHDAAYRCPTPSILPFVLQIFRCHASPWNQLENNWFSCFFIRIRWQY